MQRTSVRIQRKGATVVNVWRFMAVPGGVISGPSRERSAPAALITAHRRAGKGGLTVDEPFVLHIGQQAALHAELNHGVVGPLALHWPRRCSTVATPRAH